jgi:tRNA(Ile)-lysidine synthase
VSGGIDSMVMAHLFVQSGYKCAIAHCNFSLRGRESDGDEDLVKNFANSCNIPFYSVRFDTEGYASKNKISIQVAARELRYGWFEEIRLKNNFHKIALAHNADDNLETFFINLMRGAGLNGLTGIPANTATVVRPILGFSRKDIEEYASKNQVTFREDSSNRSNKYLRNKLRHLVLPVLKEIDSSFDKKISESMSFLKDANNYIETETEIFLKNNCFFKASELYVPLADIRSLHHPAVRLFYLLERYGFKGATITNLCRCLEKASSGKQFFSSSHRLLIDRDYLIVSPVVENENCRSTELYENSDIVTEWFEVHCKTVDKDSGFGLLKDNSIGEFDLSKLQFPLIFRPCKAGDRFVPLGMKGEKKLSDLFIDLKLPQTEKERQMVLISGDEIAWIAGLRLSEHFKVTETTKKVLRIEFKRLE